MGQRASGNGVMKTRAPNRGRAPTVFERRHANWGLLTVLENDAKVSQPPFDAITFDLALLWSE